MECVRVHSHNALHSHRVALCPGRPAWAFRRQMMATSLNATHARHHAPSERVLRYPDGHERRIIYPAVVTLDEDDEDSSVVQQQQPFHAPERTLQDTAAFLEGLFAASYASQPLQDVSQCYKVLSGCPWLMPRPVFVLTSQQWGWQAADGIQSTYTLRTKVAKEGAADAIARLLNKQHLAAALEVSEMRDGLVVFESAGDADRFASMLEEEGHSQVMVAEVDSHKLFRLVSDVHGLAVLLEAGGAMPAPYQLAASLKQQQSWDDR